MSTIQLNKIQVFGLRENKERTLNALQKLGCIDFETINDSYYKNIKNTSGLYLSKLKSILDQFETVFPQPFSEKMKIRYISANNLYALQEKEADYYSIIDKIYLIYQDITNSQLSLKDVEQQLDFLSVLKNVDLSNQDLLPTNYISSYFGTMPLGKINSLEDLCSAMDCSFDIVAQSDSIAYIHFFCLTSVVKILLDEVKLLGFQEYNGNIPAEGSFKNLYNQILEHQKLLLQKIDNLKIQILSFKDKVINLQYFFDYLSTKNKQDIVSCSAIETQFLFSLTGYIPTQSLLQLESILSEIPTVQFEVLEINTETDIIPSLIKNKRGVSSFEFITDMYSRPGKEDIDPTPFFAPFFAVFMGVAIGDAGVGFVLALISLFCIKKLRIDTSTKKLLGVCLFGGLMSIVVGILTGTYFAIPFENFGVEIPYLYKPEKQIMFALVLSFVLGYIHITFAYFIRFFHALSKKDFFGAIADGLTHIVVMFCGLLLIIGIQYPELAILKTISAYIFIVDVIVIWLTSGRHYSDTLIGRSLWGLYGVYELTAIVGDILSYARLFALGLAGGIIATAINQLTPQLLNGLSFHSVGGIIYSIFMIIIFLLILIIGHTFAAILAILGAFIHTMRLQFVEFFGKFFQGGGIPFKPFRIISKYNWIKDEHNSIKNHKNNNK